MGLLNRKLWTVPGLAAGVFAMALAAQAQPAPSAQLTIRIENLSPAGGMLRLGLYDRAHYPDDNSKPVAAADVKAIGTEMTVVLHGIAPGRYAIETFQDINADGEMDMTWLGLPKEPFGFSRDVRPRLRKPSFDQVAFTLAHGDNLQVIHLQTSISLLP